MEENSELVDFERGSTFGGLVTATVFIGFVFLILSDLIDNINNKPYTFTVRDRYMSPKEHTATKVNLGEYDKSNEFFMGIIATAEDGAYEPDFDLLDNDYIEIVTSYWDTGKNREEGKPLTFERQGPELKLCGREMLNQYLGE